MNPSKSSKVYNRLPCVTILSDHPAQKSFDEGTPFNRDLLNLESRISSIFDILRHKNTCCPLTVSLYGEWGTGKTSAMRWLETNLIAWNKLPNEERCNNPRVHPIWFDPWRYHTREDVWRGIISEVILNLFKVQNIDKQNIAVRMAAAAKKFGAFLGRGFIHALANTDFEIEPEIAGIKVGKINMNGQAIRDIWEEYEKASKPETAHLNQFEDTLATWVRDMLPLSTDGKFSERIVIFIDDLDRCLPEVTLEVLEALKLYLAIEPIIFVVGLDRNIVDAVIAEHYQKAGIEKIKAKDYLNKIFQVEFKIPPSEEQMGNFLQDQIVALNQATDGYWHDMIPNEEFRNVIESSLKELSYHNPREVKRLLNNALLIGRSAAEASILDTRLGDKKADRQLRFTQGVQVLALQKFLTDKNKNTENLFLLKRHLEWFKKVSDCVIKLLAANAISCSELCEAIKSEELQDQEDKKNSVRRKSEIYKGFDQLVTYIKDESPVDSNGSPLRISFFERDTFWKLLTIPFSIEVAQCAPRFEFKNDNTINKLDDLLKLASGELTQLISSQCQTSDTSITAEHVLNINSLRVSGEKLTHSDYRIISYMSSLSKLTLSDTDIEVDDFKFLSKLNQLQSVILNRLSFAEESLKHLTRITSLTEITISRCNLSDSWLDCLEKTSLLALKISYCKVTDKCFHQISQINSLKTLILTDTGITGNELSLLSKIPNLTNLIISDNDKLVDFNGIAKCKQLSTLGITFHSEIDEAKFSFFKRLTKVKKINLSGSFVSTTLFSFLKDLKTLETLNLNATNTDDQMMVEVCKIKNLKELNLYHSDITDRSGLLLPELTHLEILDLSQTNLTDVGIPDLLKLSFLRHLELAETNITDDSLVILSQMKKLSYLTINNTKVTSSGIYGLIKNSNLRELYISDGILSATDIAEYKLTHPEIYIEAF